MLYLQVKKSLLQCYHYYIKDEARLRSYLENKIDLLYILWITFNLCSLFDFFI